MGMIASQITSLTIVYSTVYSDADQRKHQSSASLAFVRGIHRGPVNSPHIWPVTRKMSPFDDVIMSMSLSPATGNTCTVKCLYNACHYNTNASLTLSIIGSQTMPTCPSSRGSAHGQKVWNHRGLIGHIGNDTPLFPYNWNKTKVSHLLVMSIQLIHDWSSIKHTDYYSVVLWDCHHQVNMAARCPDVENNPGSNQINMSQTQVN